MLIIYNMSMDKDNTNLWNRNPIIDKFVNYSKKRSLYKEINKYGYKLFSLSKSTINLMNTYGSENIPKNLKEYGIKVAAVVKEVNFNTIKKRKSSYFTKRKQPKELSYDNTRMASTFFRIKHIKDEMKDIALYDLVVAATNDMKEISDLNGWFSNSDNDDNIFQMTLNFLMSTPCDPLVKAKDGIQGFHTDYNILKKLNDDGTLNNYYSENYPLSVIIALQDKSYFRFLCNSHNQYDDNGRPNAALFHCKILELSIGQLIIFHPNLIHSGDIYNIYYIY